MQLKENSSEQKLRGAYYTPTALANSMVKLLDIANMKTILEPSCGDGVFIDALAAHLEDGTSVTGVEIEKDESAKVVCRYQDNKQINVVTEDFLNFYDREYSKSNYDLIIGNPPYIRYQYLSEEQRGIQSKILTDHGMKSNKLINAWVCFLVACVQLLSSNGTIAFVVPAELLQVVYAEDLRKFLSDQLKKITLITFEKLVFPDIEQEIVVLIGEKGGEEKGIRIVEMEDVSGFDTLDLKKNGYLKLQHTKEKWTKYFVSKDDIELIQKIREDDRFIRFADYGIINIGITTGNNNYFSIDKATEDKYELSSVTLPLIGRSSHAHGIFFTKEDWLVNVKNGKKAMLVKFPEMPLSEYPELHRDYIKYGETTEQNLGYKCSIRNDWYIVPSVWVPDAFFLRRNNLYPKFVLNSCSAVSTDTMHRMKFNDDIDPEVALLSYYNSISFAFAEICGRSYGGGVLEILPREMGNIIVPNVRGVDSVLRDRLLQNIDDIVRNDENIEIALDLVDKEILINTLGIDAELCMQCRGIWKKLQKRRLGRT
ncbi:DNA methyltransferase [Clostridia bacterium]|nr:DNA methyltransferase [Clostridia bacterium]